MSTKQDLDKLISEIMEKQEELNKEFITVTTFSRWVAASRRARVLSAELGNMYKQYRKLSIEVAKNQKESQ